MRYPLATFILVAAAAIPAHARQIQGTVYAENDSTAIPGALCELRTEGTTLSSTITGQNGAFSLTTDRKTPLTLNISMAGFSPAEIIIENGSGNVDAGPIFLSDAVTLSEVTVTGSSAIDSKGRTIIFPSGADVRASATSIRLLEKLPLPGLEANPINRTIAVDGGQPMILINGVPSSLDDLNALQPKDILKIEYSRMTPARYADKGVSGLINITLKKRDDGGQVFAWGRSAVNTAFVDASIRASYHQGPSQFTLSYRPSWRNYQAVYDFKSQSYIGDDFRVDLLENDRNPFNYLTNNLQLKYAWSPDMKTLLTATFNAGISSDKRTVYGHTKDTFLGEYDTDNISRSKQFSPSLDIFFRRDFNEKNSLEAQVVGTLSSDDYRRDNTYIFSGEPNDISETYIMNVDNRRRSLITEISYTHSFSDRTSLSGGFQNTLSHSRNTYLDSDYKPVLTENNNYIYARFGQQAGPVYISLATGAKLFWVKNDLNKRHFIRNLSTVQLSWTISPKWSLTGAFQYSPSIPSLAALTDYPQQSSPYLISNGNPDLKVAEYFKYQLYPTFRHKKFTATLSLFYSHVTNPVVSDIIYMGDRKFLSQSINADKADSFFGALSLRISDIYGFGANATISLDHYENAGPGWSHHLTSVNGNLSVWWNKGPVTISYWRKFPGKYLSGHYVGKEENGDALSVEYRPNSHLTLGVDWMYMFDKKGTRYPGWSYSSVNPYYRERYIKNNSNMVVISVSYSTDFGSIFRTARRNLNNSDNGSSLLKL